MSRKPEDERRVESRGRGTDGWESRNKRHTGGEKRSQEAQNAIRELSPAAFTGQGRTGIAKARKHPGTRRRLPLREVTTGQLLAKPGDRGLQASGDD